MSEDWNGWVSVGQIASSAKCSRSIFNIIQQYKVDKKIDLKRNLDIPYVEREYDSDQIMGKIAEDVLQYIMSGNTSEDIIQKGQDMLKWIKSTRFRIFVANNSSSVKLCDLDFPWATNDYNFVGETRWKEGDFIRLIKICESWNIQAKANKFDDLLWFSEYKIRVNFQLPDGKFLPISGRMDLRSKCEEEPMIIEIKTTDRRTLPSAFNQVEMYVVMEQIINSINPDPYVFHENELLPQKKKRIVEILETANYDIFDSSLSNCRFCESKGLCEDATLS